MKILLMPDNIDQIYENLDSIEGIVVGIEGLSFNISLLLKENELDDFFEKFKKKKIFICLNKNYQNEDINYLTRVLKKSKNHYILFYDFAILNLNIELKLNLKLIWHNEHFTTNYHSLETLKDRVKGMVISLDLDLEEIKEIIKKSNQILIMPIFGHQPIFNSFRNLIGNYCLHYQIDNKGQVMLSVDNNNLIVGDENQTTIYSPIVNGFDLIENLKVDYFIVNGFKIENNILKKVLQKKIRIGEEKRFFQKQHYRLGDKV